MVNLIVNMEMTDQQKKWSQFVETNKYFRASLTRSRSAPCLQMVRKMRSAPVLGTTNLSLSWQLACNPADSSHLNVDCVQRSHFNKHVTKNSKFLKSSYKRKSKIKPKEKPGGLPQIKVVHVIKKVPLHDLEYQSKPEKCGDIEIEGSYNKQNQPTVRPRAEMVAKRKRSYGVPLCYRPTTLLGPRYYTDLQNYNQQQYYNYIQEQQRQQQLMWQKLYYRPLQHISRSKQEYYDQGPRYAVPIESKYHNVTKGSRYCGNFYYR